MNDCSPKLVNNSHYFNLVELFVWYKLSSLLTYKHHQLAELFFTNFILFNKRAELAKKQPEPLLPKHPTIINF